MDLEGRGDLRLFQGDQRQPSVLDCSAHPPTDDKEPMASEV